MNSSRYTLRPEAAPVPYDSLNQSQEKAMKAIVMALKEAAAQAENSKKSNDHDGLVDPDRVSRLFFVSGQPGSGKSSLYLTLRAILGKEERYDDIREKYQKKIQGLSGLNGATRWLEQIDLEVAGDEGENLLAAVLVRIFAAIDDSSGIATKDCQDAMNQLNELANDIGIAWEGNLKARAPSLDPQSYSLEVMSAQRARLNTNNRLREVLDALLKKKCYDFTNERLFVLPIDDFYLKPAASLELLRLLRMISVPRLFFLIMGDIKTMEALFFEKALADWTAIAGPQVFASLKERREAEILPRVREMRARYLRKLLPAAQRAIIEWMNWDEALRYQPTVADSSDRGKKLSCLLFDICLKGRPTAAPHNLRDYLVAPKLAEGDGHVSNSEEKTEEQAKRLKRFQEAYSALQILDATPREAVDLWMCLSELVERREQSDDEKIPPYLKKAPPYLWTAVDFVLLAIEEQDFLTEKQQDPLRFAFPTSHKDNLRVDTDKFSLTPKFSRKLNISSDYVFVCEHLDWKLGISSVATNSAGPVPYLPPRAAAWIILLHDLAWDWQEESITTNLVHKLLKEIGKSSIPLTPKQKEDLPCPEDPEKAMPGPENPGWAWYSHKNEWLHFPFPNLDTFRQLDRFLTVWSVDMPSPDSKKPLNLDTLLRRWVFAAWIAEGSDNCYENFVNEKYSIPETKEEEEKCVGLSEYRNTLLPSKDRIHKALAIKEHL